jgi:hypothetical protein
MEQYRFHKRYINLLYNKPPTNLSFKKLATVTSEATRLFQHCNITSRAHSLKTASRAPTLCQNYEQWIRNNRNTVKNA